LVVGTQKSNEETFGSYAQSGGDFVSFDDVAETCKTLRIIKKLQN
jgi:hypothetical protein